jgi:hypothetical protein
MAGQNCRIQMGGSSEDSGGALTSHLAISEFRYWGNLDWDNCQAEGFFQRHPRSTFYVALEDTTGPHTYGETRVGQMEIQTEGTSWSWSTDSKGAQPATV